MHIKATIPCKIIFSENAQNTALSVNIEYLSQIDIFLAGIISHKIRDLYKN